jgi:hypothetical protein
MMILRRRLVENKMEYYHKKIFRKSTNLGQGKAKSRLEENAK